MPLTPRAKMVLTFDFVEKVGGLAVAYKLLDSVKCCHDANVLTYHLCTFCETEGCKGECTAWGNKT